MWTSVASPWAWAGFVAFILLMLALDLGVFHRESETVSAGNALVWTGVWVALSCVFGGLVYFWFGADRALEYFAGYLIEKALSVDNIFVFIVVFQAFAVPAKLQHRVLFWGILGALVLRAIFILLGAALLAKFHAAIYVFGAFLLITGVKMLRQEDDEIDPRRNILFRGFRRLVPAVEGYRGQRFTVVENGRRYATPLLLVLIAIETTDLVFAVDSIPAIFAVTQDPFIVFTSNIFAILGLRSLYFALADMVSRFHLLKYGLSLVLVFVGGKMLASGWVKVPIAVSLGIIVLLLVGAVVASLLIPAKQPEEGEASP